MPTPIETYRVRLAERQLVVAARERTHVALGNAKVAIVIATLIYWAVTVQDSNSTLLGAAAVAFVALLIWHELVMRALARCCCSVGLV